METRKWKRDTCNPSRRRKRYCYSQKNLLKIRNAWNRREPRKIHATEYDDLWNQLRNHIHNCNHESCWLKQPFMRGKVDDDIKDSFAPMQPREWIKNKVEWLSSTDILDVMTQYEKTYKHFDFLGPSPIDYREVVLGQCVWDELCKFDLHKMLQRGKTQIGIVFNLDTHDKSGSHWVAMFIDVPHRGIYYFDSTGDAMPLYLNQFVTTIMEQGKKMNMHFRFKQNHPKEHQQGGTECGIYVLYFIVNMIHHGNFKMFNSRNHTIPDKMMEELRDDFFNENKN